MPQDPPDHRDAAATRHFHPHPERRLAIRLMKFADVVFSRAYHDLTVLAPPQVPPSGPAILVCNHTSGLDPLLIQSVTQRIVVWMMAQEYYDIRPLTPFFRTLEAIPVDRKARDTSAMRLALRALHDGRVLGVFPEGRIEKRRELLPFQPGVVQMAIKAGCPVCPAFLDGTQHAIDDIVAAFINRQEATIRFGPPLTFDRKEGVEAATARLRDAIWSLRTPRFQTFPAETHGK